MSVLESEIPSAVKIGTKLNLKRFVVLRQIGKGGFGDVFLAFDNEKQKHVAIKVDKQGISSVRLESKALTRLHGGHPLGGFPNLIFFGSHKSCEYLVMELLGPNLSDLFKFCDSQFSLKTILMLTDQLILRLHQLHLKGFVHRDIKPENIMMGLGVNSSTAHLGDFGLIQPYINEETEKHISIKNIGECIGTPRFMSTNAHLKMQLSRRDDLESLAFTLMYFTSGGKLPWSWFQEIDDDPTGQLIVQSKSQTPPDKLFLGMPLEFALFLKKIRELKFDEEPEYMEYRRMFWNLAFALEYEYDWKFDWTEKMTAQ